MSAPGLSAQERVIELLRTLSDARVDWDGRSDGEGALLMPRTWREHYMELERCLIELRSSKRRLWWHISMRYRFGTTSFAVLPVIRTRKGARFQLPKRTELVAGGPAVGGKHALARVYQWTDEVDDDLVTEGVELLTAMMYDGQTGRICLPLDLYRRVMAEKLVAA